MRLILFLLLPYVCTTLPKREELCLTPGCVREAANLIDNSVVKNPLLNIPYIEKEKLCLTPGCVRAAANLINNIDNSVDPCEDFYEFACGNYIKETVIPDDKTAVGAFPTAIETLDKRLKKIFESSDTEGPFIFKSVRNFYNSCMDLDNLDTNARADLLGIVDELGGWPVLGHQFDPDQFEWEQLMVKANSLGFHTGKVLSLSVAVDAENSTKRIIEIDEAKLGLEREYLIKGFEDKDVQAYYKYMVDAAEYLSQDSHVDKEQLKDALLFEIELANLTMKREDKRNLTALNNKMSLAELTEIYDNIDWVKLSNQMLGDSTETLVDSDEVVNVVNPKFVRDVKELLAKTDPKTVANYMMWRFVKDSFVYLGQDATDITLEYKEVLSGTKQPQPRWQTCVISVAGNDFSGVNWDEMLYWQEGSLTNAVGSMYARKYFPLEDKRIVDEMVDYIRKEFKIMLDEVDWMDEKTRKEAHIKADLMTSFMAYSKEILDDELLNEFYTGLILDDTSYLKNYLTLRRFIIQYYADNFRHPIDNKSWKTHGGAAMVNAFYSAEENSIQFPAGILDGVFFQADRPSYMNYGAIGVVIGHEITHGFDDVRSQTDGEGNLRNWWEPYARENFLEKSQCFVEQYGNFTVEVEGETLNLNGQNTQGENIADNGGYKEAIRAYLRLVEDQGEESGLPGLSYTPRQLFWLSAGSIWCEVRTPASLKNQVLTGYHSPGRFRVIGSFRNQKEFAEDWNCPIGSPMNPVKKCSVW